MRAPTEGSLMKVVPVAHTVLTHRAYELFDELGFDPFNPPNSDWHSLRDGDILPEFSGRLCYESYHKPNPETASNKDYIGKNLIGKKHESCFEHASVCFYVSGVSRNLLLELERHRHLSFSVISTRYVSPDKMGFALHPNTPEIMIKEIIDGNRIQRTLAQKIYNVCMAEGMGIKQARECARQVLPGNLETKFVVTGNMRAWRYVIALRNHETADKEIQLFSAEVLKHLKKIAPNTFQDMT